MEKGARIAGKKADHSSAAISDGEVKRIFIGGVGAGVTDADVDKTFSPLGRVHSVEIVRSNGRNFAFMDFEPSSVKSMANLFSTYNGCTWKGGKLKLEIAKEHYLTRLKREWVEDAKPASAPPATEGNLKVLGSQFSNQENSQIRIFFPKLRKVKPLPFKGSGKHKYSFQRVEVSPLPIHFCDCEEHSKSLETIVHEKERNLMSNVINKLIERDNSFASPGGKLQDGSGVNVFSSSKGEGIQSKEAEVFDADDDNLMMNVGTMTEDDVLMQLKGAMALLTGQGSRFDNPPPVENKADSSKREKPGATDDSSIKPSKRSRSVSADRLSQHEPAPATAQNITSDFALCESSPPSTFISSKPSDKALEPLHETPAAERQLQSHGSNAQLPEGRSWVQKASWKNLIGGEGSSSFSLSALLGLTPAPSKVPANSDAANANTGPAEKRFETLGTKSTRITPLISHSTSGMRRKPPSSVRGKPGGGEMSVQEQRKETSVFSLGEVRPFMRSAESEHQWSRAKAALSGLLKRKGNGGKAMAPGKR
ncbi:hypothetical protein KSP39_PZI001717 [Platanthera zijinensis]|uniref:RRM domain-containing protein n=1 Tax=Platanthera zijinensis TaxID=2320716 RepID=A0AAP0C148_9ASPA